MAKADSATAVAAVNLSMPGTGVGHTSLPGLPIACPTLALAGQQLWNLRTGFADKSVQVVSPATVQRLGLPHVDNFTVQFQPPLSARALSGLRLSLTMPTESDAAAVAKSGLHATVLSTEDELAHSIR